MLDFLNITTRITKTGGVEVVPKFRIYPQSKDLMVRGKDFYAIWVEELGMWSTDEHVALQLIDKELDRYARENPNVPDNARILYMWDSDTGMVDAFHKFCQKQLRDNFHMLDEELIFSNTETSREHYASKRLSYPLEAGDITAYDKIIGTLYSPEERHKIEWAIGSIVSGDSRWLQKFMVFYGAAGTGKSTIMNIIQQLFEGYYSVFEAKALGQANNSFALEPFKTNPLVAIQHDGDLSRMEDNTRLNSLVSHERMTVNEKHKGIYENEFKCFLFLGTNRPVKITDGKSGLLRRLIDVTPTGNKIATKEYHKLIKAVEFELGAIAHHCLEVYSDDPHYYDDYTPISMMGASNDFYNFVEDHCTLFRREDGITLKIAWENYKAYAEEANLSYQTSKRVFKEELKNYFHDFHEKFEMDDGTMVYNYYRNFRKDIFEKDTTARGAKEQSKPEETIPSFLEFKEQPSLLDELCKDYPAQYSNTEGKPRYKWLNVKTTLSDLDTHQLHYLKVPIYHIVVDFDIPDEDGNKCFELNAKAASKFPPTYGELSKSGGGIHLHYIYNGDPEQLSRIYDEHIEVKVSIGDSSIRRKLSKCNDIPIATISSGLPLKEGGKLVRDFEGIKNQQHLVNILNKHIDKEIMGHTKPSIDMIYKTLQDAYESGIQYDVSDMRNDIVALAASSTNNAMECLKMVNQMKFKSENIEMSEVMQADIDEIVFYDCEVFPNLFLVNWKIAGEGQVVNRMINPKPHEIENLLKYKLIGFNNRNYDNHMLHGALMGYSNEELYRLSKRLIHKDKTISSNAKFSTAYNYSFTDVYDFSSAMNKKSLKKWEIELGITHHELGLDWDEPVPEELWTKVAEYCDDDVLATEAVFNHLKGDWTAREILADLAGEGSTVNDTTNTLTTRIIFGSDKNPNLTYTDLATGDQYDIHENLIPKEERVDTGVINSFPGYEYVWDEDKRKYCNKYRGEDIGFGGYIRSNPGMYGNVGLLDIASLHPTSLIMMNYFGKYTPRYADLKQSRIYIKHDDFDSARNVLDGKLAKYLNDQSVAKDLSNALKTCLNSTYGLTSASFNNAMRHPMNKNNIIALRGALFMKTLQDEVEAKGYEIVAIKTDSIKIADIDKEIVDFCMEFAALYGYEFEFEACYDKMCQINDADYVARYKDVEWCEQEFGFVPGDNRKHAGQWTATGKRFQIPYVFKSLFSHEDLEFNDLSNVFSVQGALYLDMNKYLPDVTEYEKEFLKAERKYKKGLLGDTTFEDICNELRPKIDEGHDYHFVGRVGQFTPVKSEYGGGILVSKQGDKYNSANGAKGYRWLESELIKGKEDIIDMGYFNKLADEAVELISEHGDFEWFVSDESYINDKYFR